MPPDYNFVDDVTAESASTGKKTSGGVGKEAIISLSVIISMLLMLFIGVAIVMVRLKKEKKVLLPQSRRGRLGKTSGIDRSSTERGSQASGQRSQALRGSQASEQRSQASEQRSQASEQRSQAPWRKQSNSSQRDPDESRMTVNVMRESGASPAPTAPMSSLPALARAPQVCRRKMLRSSSGSGGSVEQQAGSWLHRQLPAASPLHAASPMRRCRSADAPAEQPQ